MISPTCSTIRHAVLEASAVSVSAAVSDFRRSVVQQHCRRRRKLTKRGRVSAVGGAQGVDAFKTEKEGEVSCGWTLMSKDARS